MPRLLLHNTPFHAIGRVSQCTRVPARCCKVATAAAGANSSQQAHRSNMRYDSPDTFTEVPADKPEPESITQPPTHEAMLPLSSGS